jgi:hypothetical protein
MEQYFEAPSYGESARDQQVLRPVLYFNQPQSIKGHISEATGAPLILDTVQVLLALTKPVEGCVQVRGDLTRAETARHHTPWVLEAKDIKPAVSCTPVVQAKQCSASRAVRFAHFWRDFRAAALKADCAKLAQFAAQNFSTKGSLDIDPTIKLKASQIAKQCPVWLSAEDAVDAQSSSLEIFFRRNASAPADWRNGSETQARVGPLVFRQTNGCWRWTRYYRTD